MTGLPELAAALRALLPGRAGVAQTDARLPHAPWAGEALRGATPARLREFAAGRAAFRAALAEAGLPPCALPMAPDRSPVWPPGLAASISHDAGACLAAVLPGAAGLGIDIEPDGDLPTDLRDSILTDAESHATPREARLIFSAKEAAYKAIYPQIRRVIGFDAMRIVQDGNRLTATLALACPPFAAGHTFHGHVAWAEGRIVTVFILD